MDGDREERTADCANKRVPNEFSASSQAKGKSVTIFCKVFPRAFLLTVKLAEKTQRHVPARVPVRFEGLSCQDPMLPAGINSTGARLMARTSTGRRRKAFEREQREGGRPTTARESNDPETSTE